MNCRVKFCSNLMASRGILCADHWALVPERLRMSIWDAYRPGQHSQWSTNTAPPEYRRLISKAIRVATERDRNNELDRDRAGVRKR